MPKIPYADLEKAAPETVRLVGKMQPAKNIGRMLAHSPKAMKAFMRLGHRLFVHAELTHRHRELAILRIARLCGSRYEYAQHVPVALGFGVTREEIEALDDPERWGIFGEAERLVLRFTDEVTLRVRPEEETLRSLGEHLSPRAIIELTLAVGYWNMAARFLETTGVELDEDIPDPR